MEVFPLDVENLILSYLLQCKKCNKYDLKLINNKCEYCFNYDLAWAIIKVCSVITITVPIIELGYIYFLIWLVSSN